MRPALLINQESFENRPTAWVPALRSLTLPLWARLDFEKMFALLSWAVAAAVAAGVIESAESVDIAGVVGIVQVSVESSGLSAVVFESFGPFESFGSSGASESVGIVLVSGQAAVAVDVAVVAAEISVLNSAEALVAVLLLSSDFSGAFESL